MPPPMKRSVLNTIARSSLVRLFERFRPPGATIFSLHRFSVPDLGIQGHDLALLRTNLAALRTRRERIVGLGDLLGLQRDGHPLNRPVFSFTVDDGYADFAAVAAPIFAEFDCPVTVFLISDFVSGRMWNWWDQVEFVFARSRRTAWRWAQGSESSSLDWRSEAERAVVCSTVVERLKLVPDLARVAAMQDLAAGLEVEIPAQAPEQYRAMAWEQVRALGGRGVTFGPHTVTHPILSQVDDARAEAEITDSWRAVSEATPASVPVFCYPNGNPLDFGPRDEMLVARAGMLAAVSNQAGFASRLPLGVGLARQYSLPRFSYPDHPAEFLQIQSGLESWKRRFRGDPSPESAVSRPRVRGGARLPSKVGVEPVMDAQWAALVSRALPAIGQGSHWSTALAADNEGGEALSAADEFRGAWLWLANLGGLEVAADFSGGLGSQAAALSRHFGTVHCFERRPAFRDFLKARFAQDRNPRVEVGRLDHPIPDESLDCVCVHGIDNQRARLTSSDARMYLRLLRRGGVLSLGIEYRRSETGRLSGLLRPGTIDRTLRGAGFSVVESYYIEPSLGSPVRIVPRNAAEVIGSLQTGRSSLAAFSRRLLARAGLHAALHRSLQVVAYR